jgi:hypothetical protein
MGDIIKFNHDGLVPIEDSKVLMENNRRAFVRYKIIIKK